MANNGIYFYKLVSPYPQDVTKNCKLTINEIDSNFFNLESYDIESADFIREEKVLVLTRVNGEKLIVDLSDVVYDLQANVECTDDGLNFSMHYDGKDGPNDVTMEHLITLDMLRNKIEELLGTDILTKVITDGTLKGDGTLNSPLGLKGTEKTGMYAPVISRIDLTNGGKLPEVAKLGTRYATIEYVNDYGYLYNDAGVDKIAAQVEEEGRGWRVPSKNDWDRLLNLIEPCQYRNHDDAACHKELGMFAGKYLKSACGWLGQPECACSATVPVTGCTVDNGTMDGESGDYIDDTDDYGVPQEAIQGPEGVDKFGMCVLPSGVGMLDGYGRPQYNSFREKAVFWTTSHVYGDVDQDKYVKVFDWNKGGVVQEAECPSPYYSVRLVKDYDGSNYFDTEYIDGVPYKTILFPEIRQIWLASNYAKKEGFVEYSQGVVPEVIDVNAGEVNEKRKAVFINEWNGCYWEKKELVEGDTVVIQNPCFDTTDDETTTTITWIDGDGFEHSVDVVLPEVTQYNIEYRVYTTSEDSCDQDLINTDYLAIERLLRTVMPIIEAYRKELKDDIADLQDQIDDLDDKLDDEIARSTAKDEELESGLTQEIARAMAAEEELENEILDEISRATSAETQLREALDDEIAARKAVDGQEGPTYVTNEGAYISAATSLNDADIKLDEGLREEVERAKAAEAELAGGILDPTKDYVMSASTESNYNLVLETKDGVEEHFIKIKFDGNFGEI